jgi:hypothetical protein
MSALVNEFGKVGSLALSRAQYHRCILIRAHDETSALYRGNVMRDIVH